MGLVYFMSHCNFSVLKVFRTTASFAVFSYICVRFANMNGPKWSFNSIACQSHLLCLSIYMYICHFLDSSLVCNSCLQWIKSISPSVWLTSAEQTASISMLYLLQNYRFVFINTMALHYNLINGHYTSLAKQWNTNFI